MICYVCTIVQHALNVLLKRLHLCLLCVLGLMSVSLPVQSVCAFLWSYSFYVLVTPDWFTVCFSSMLWVCLDPQHSTPFKKPFSGFPILPLLFIERNLTEWVLWKSLCLKQKCFKIMFLLQPTLPRGISYKFCLWGAESFYVLHKVGSVLMVFLLFYP